MTDSRRNIYFLSDLHLGSSWHPDPAAAERHVVEWLDFVKDDAREIILVGDVLDYWYEYRYVVPRGHVRFFGKIAELADSGVKITWLRGNHDIWIFDYLPVELGIEVATGPIVRTYSGKRFFIEHGDGVGRRPRKERIMRAIFHNRFCQRLFATINPRWTVAFAYGWSHSNRGKHPQPHPYEGPEKEPLILFAREHLKNEPTDYYIFGHRHILVRQQLQTALPDGSARNAEAIILGNWIDRCAYALFDGTNLFLHEYPLNDSL